MRVVAGGLLIVAGAICFLAAVLVRVAPNHSLVLELVGDAFAGLFTIAGTIILSFGFGNSHHRRYGRSSSSRQRRDNAGRNI